MALMALCGLLVLLGLAMVVRWGGLEVRRPRTDGGGGESVPSPGLVARWYLWYVTVAVVSGLGAGLLLAGAGGRLAMRLLAVTAGDAAQGRLTEAEEVVGRITVDGTVGFIIFVGLFSGLATGTLYLAIRRWLPSGRLGGLTFGALLLVVAATRVEPLRADNPDFGIVGPGWVALVVFAALVVAHGGLVAALAGRYSRALPLISRRPRDVLAYTPMLLLVPVAPALAVLALAGFIVVGLSRIRPLMEALRSHSVTLAGRVALTAIAVLALPGFVAVVSDIARSTP